VRFDDVRWSNFGREEGLFAGRRSTVRKITHHPHFPVAICRIGYGLIGSTIRMLWPIAGVHGAAYRPLTGGGIEHVTCFGITVFFRLTCLCTKTGLRGLT
jgi:hypothetical protein